MFRYSLYSVLAALALSVSVPAFAYTPVFDENGVAEFNPADPDAGAELDEADSFIENLFGESPFLSLGDQWAGSGSSCYRASCAVWADVRRSTQTLSLYLNGQLQDQWSVSTGMKGYSTPNFDKHPENRIYKKYSSNKFPGGDYNGLGNMPYAVFIRGGYALHGTPRGNWRRLGSVASHGCVRQNPAKAQYFNSLVRQVGIRNTWITVRQ